MLILGEWERLNKWDTTGKVSAMRWILKKGESQEAGRAKAVY